LFIGLLQLRYSLHDHTRLYLFTIFVLITWGVWLLKVVLSRRYEPWTAPYETTTTVVVPVVDEPLDLFHEVLRRIVAQHPTQTIVVINGPRNVELERVCQQFGGSVEWTWTSVAGKRNAVRIGVERSIGEIVLLVDSDTIWTENTLEELVKPFADPGVGGASTRQRILEPKRNFLTRWADWLENSRALYSMPAQSVLGTIGCLPGRTIAFRRTVLVTVMHDFLTQKFLGVLLEVSDDRTLTNLTLKQGFRTVYQSTSLVYTDAPTRLKKLVKQQYRWARGSQYNTLRMLPWMLGHAPLLAFFFLADIILPFLWVCSAVAWIVRTSQHKGVDFYSGMLDVHHHALIAIIVLTVLTSTLSMALRQLRHISEVPGDLIRMPFYILFSTLVLMPIRIYGFIRLGHIGGWGTRADAFTADQGRPVESDEGAGAIESGEPISQTAGSTFFADRRSDRSTQTVLAEPIQTTTREGPTDGDPRGLIPYAIASAILILGVLYDVHPV
jgi:hyaluronan synthase